MLKKDYISIIIILIIIIFLLTGCSGSDSNSISTSSISTNLSGVITDQDNGLPIKGATVSLGVKSTSTDEQGVYSFKDISPDEYRLRIEADGYQSIEEMVIIKSEGNIINRSLSKAQMVGKVTVYNTIKSRNLILQSTQIATQSIVNKSESKILSLKQSNLLAKYKKSEIIVKYTSSASSKSIAKLYKKNRLKKIKEKKGKLIQYKLPKNKKVKEMIKYYRKLPEVEWVIPNYLAHVTAIPSDSKYVSRDYSWAHINANLEAAWDIQRGSSDVVVAVVDSGVIPKHPDLANNLLSGADFVGEANPELSFDMTDTDPTDETSQSNGGSHGTHVAGILGAVTNNGEGIAGVSWDTSILPVRVIGTNGSGTLIDLVEGLEYAIEQNVDIINMSLGFPHDISEDAKEFLKGYIDRAVNAGITVVAAAGNEDGPILYPAAFDNVIAVGAVNCNNERTWYSNYGTEIDIVAPGGTTNMPIMSTWGYYENGQTYYEPGYIGMTGTSMAAPYVSGISTLLIADGLNGTQQIHERLINATIDLGATGKDDYYGYGLVDAYGTLLGKKLGKPVVFAATKDGNNLYVKSEMRNANDDGTYEVAQVDNVDVYIVGWRDVNKNQIVDTGDYYGISSKMISVDEGASYAVNFDMYYVSDSSESNGLEIID